MFCEKCGAQVPENSKFCEKCGAVMEVAQVPQIPVAEKPPRKPLSRFLIGGIAVAMAAILVAVIVAVSMIGASDITYRNLVNKHVQAMIDGDSRAMVSTLPRSWVNILILGEYGGDRDEFYEELDEEIGYLKRQIRENDMEVTWEIVDIAEMDENTENELEMLEDMMGMRIGDCRIVTIDLHTTMDGETKTKEEQIILGKVGLSWYVINPMGF